jgi:hypothetical protein
MPNAGYYFMQNACEPVHLQLNLNNLMVTAINRTYKPVSGMTAQADIFDIYSKSIFHEEKKLDLSETAVKETTSLTSVLSASAGIKFVVLNLKDNNGKVISHNVYWLSNDKNYTSLNDMQKTSVEAKVVNAEKGASEDSWTIQISNNTDKIAFFVRPQLMIDKEEVLPSYWSASYFTLAPSESTTITVSCPVVKLEGRKPVIQISGWNVNQQELVIN